MSIRVYLSRDDLLAFQELIVILRDTEHQQSRRVHFRNSLDLKPIARHVAAHCVMPVFPGEKFANKSLVICKRNQLPDTPHFTIVEQFDVLKMFLKRFWFKSMDGHDHRRGD